MVAICVVNEFNEAVPSCADLVVLQQLISKGALNDIFALLYLLRICPLEKLAAGDTLAPCLFLGGVG